MPHIFPITASLCGRRFVRAPAWGATWPSAPRSTGGRCRLGVPIAQPDREHGLQVALTLAGGAAAAADLREPGRGPGAGAMARRAALDAAHRGPVAGSARARLVALTTALHLGVDAIGAMAWRTDLRVVDSGGLGSWSGRQHDRPEGWRLARRCAKGEKARNGIKG